MAHATIIHILLSSICVTVFASLHPDGGRVGASSSLEWQVEVGRRDERMQDHANFQASLDPLGVNTVDDVLLDPIGQVGYDKEPLITHNIEDRSHNEDVQSHAPFDEGKHLRHSHDTKVARLLGQRERDAWEYVRNRVARPSASRSPSVSRTPSTTPSPSESSSSTRAIGTPSQTRPASASATMASSASTTKSAQPPSASPTAFPTPKPAGSEGSLLLQNGYNGYASQEDISLSTMYIDAWNAYNGVTWPAGADGTNILGISSDGTEYRSLVRFNNIDKYLSIPAGSQLVRATLSLTFRLYITGHELSVHYFKPGAAGSWNTSTCCPNNAGTACDQCQPSGSNTIGWAFREKQVRWTSPGALNDTIPGREAHVGNFSWNSIGPFALVTREIPLDVGVVSNWIVNASTNNGMLIRMARSPPGWDYSSKGSTYSEHVSGSAQRLQYQAFRPALRLTWDYTGNSGPVVTEPQRTVARGRHIYVDAVNGSDIYGSGFIERPLRTLNRAMQDAGEGDTVLLREGVYAGGFSIQRSGITLMSLPGHRAVISAPMTPNIGSVIQLRPDASRTTIKNVEIQGSYYYGILVDTTFDWGGSWVRGVFTSTAARNVLIENVTIHHVGTTGIRLKMGATGVTIRKSRIFRTGHRVPTYGHCIDAINAPGLVVEDCICEHAASSGIVLSAGTSAIIRRNFISNVGLIGIAVGWYSDADQFDETVNPQYFQSVDTTVVNNVIHFSRGAGIGIYSAARASVLHNTLFGVAHESQAAVVIAPTQVWISQNLQPIVACDNITLFNNIVHKDAIARKGPHLQIRALDDCCTDRPAPLPGLRHFIPARYQGPHPRMQSFTSGGNVYIDAREPSTSVFQWGRGVMLEDERYFLGASIAGVGKDITPNISTVGPFVGNITGWRARYGLDLVEAGSVEADPKISDGTFAPGNCGAAVTHAAALPPWIPVVDDDFFGNPRQSTFAGAIPPGSTVNLLAWCAPTDYCSSPIAQFPGRETTVDYPMTAFNGVGDQAVYDQHIPRVIVVDAVSGFDTCATAHVCGSISTPFKTVAYAMTKVGPGDTIQLRNGTHAGGFAVYMPNITIESFPGEWAIVKAPVDNSAISAAIRIVPWGNIWMEASDLTIRRLEIVGGYYYALFNNQVPAVGDYWRTYMAFRGLKPRGYTLIEDVYMHDAGTSVVKLSPFADHMVFRRCEIAYSGKRATQGAIPTVNTQPTDTEAGNPEEQQASGAPKDVFFGSGNGIDNRNGNFMVVEDSYIHHIAGTGILMGGGARGCRVERNLVQEVDGIGIMIGSFNTEIQYHDVWANPQAFENVGAVVLNNIVYKAGGAGIAFYSAKDAAAVHNTLVDVAAVMQAAVLYNLSPQISVHSRGLFPANTNCTFANNVITQAEGSSAPTVEYRVMQATTRPRPVPLLDANTSCSAPSQGSEGQGSVITYTTRRAESLPINRARYFHRHTP